MSSTFFYNHEGSHLLQIETANEGLRIKSLRLPILIAVVVTGLLIKFSTTNVHPISLIDEGRSDENGLVLDDYYDWMTMVLSRYASTASLSTDIIIDVDQDQATMLKYLNHTETYDSVMDAEKANLSDYFDLNLGFDAQINQAYCGVASSATVLNSLQSRLNNELPVDKVYAPYHYATQKDILKSSCVESNVLALTGQDGKDDIWTAPVGLSLVQVGELMTCQFKKFSSSWNVEISCAVRV